MNDDVNWGDYEVQWYCPECDCIQKPIRVEDKYLTFICPECGSELEPDEE